MKHRSKLTVRGKTFLCFGIFTACIVLLLWLFQTVFLQDFYKWIKTNNIYSTADTITRALNAGNLQEVLDGLARQEEVCIHVQTSDGTVYDADVLPDCMVHHFSARDQAARYLQALQNSGEYMEHFVRRRVTPQFSGEFVIDEGGGKLEGYDNMESILYTRVLSGENDDADTIIMLNTLISPVGATVQTLRIQLVWISVILIVLALILSILISRKISQPILQITRAASDLVGGEFHTQFNGRGYREIDQLNRTLQCVAQELQKTEQLRRDLIANVSHDLRTPLTMITGYAEVIRDIPGENTPENIQIIIEEAQRLTSLVNDLLDLSRLQSGTQKLQISRFCITQTVRQTLHRYRKLTQQDGYTILFDYDQEVFLTADELRISQVIYNLINNAINYTGEDRRVTVIQRVQDNWVRIGVRDTGEGIPQEQLQWVWERYYKLDKTHKRAAVGTGLGLSIVRSVMELHGGRYGVLSTPGIGSEFWFSLPLAGPQELPGHGDPSGKAQSRPQGPET